MRSLFIHAYPPARPLEGPARWLVFRNGELLLLEGEQAALMDRADHLFEQFVSEPVFLGTLSDISYIAAELPQDAPAPEGAQALGLRALYGRLDEDEYSIAGYAAQILYWQRSSRFCPVCGNPTEPVGGDWGRRCTVCGFARYPQISPAILALVHDGDRVLLTHKAGWGPMFSIIAGFVEPNESLEACVHREVAEEVGVTVGKVEYRGSQGWPFPAQLMIGFMCEYASGELAIDDKELDDARWFHVDELPPLPGPISLSRQLLDMWIASRGK